jgi:hypothetical protein
MKPRETKSVFRKMFRKMLADMEAAGKRFEKIRSAPKPQRVAMLVEALDDPSELIPPMAAEALGKSGKAVAVPGICRALKNASLRFHVATGIHEALKTPAKVETAFREQILQHVLSMVIDRDQETFLSDAVGLVLALSPERGAHELLFASAKAPFPLPKEQLLRIINWKCSLMQTADLVLAAEALLPHRAYREYADAFDHLMQRLQADSVKLPPKLSKALKADQKAAKKADPAFAGMSSSLRRIAQTDSDYWDKISALHTALDDRLARKGVEVGYNRNQKQELKHLTRPEWIIRTLNCFLCGCENSGSLAGQEEMGIPLAKYFEEVGIPGCAKALRTMKEIVKEEKARERLDPDDEDLYGCEYQERMEQAEADGPAEGMEECCERLWHYALEHRAEILQEV